VVAEKSFDVGIAMEEEPKEIEVKPKKTAKRKASPQETQPQYVKRFKALIAKIKPDEKVAIFTHVMPDPDAMASMMGVKWMLDHLSVESEAFYLGSVSHPQNLAMVNLLDPQMKPVDQFVKKDFKYCMMVDCLPDGPNSGAPDVPLSDFSLIIDHHRVDPSDFKGIYINLKNGSCAGSIYHLIKIMNLTFDEDNARDRKVATALMVGISTDTDNLLADSSTEYEFEAYWHLFDKRDTNALKEIVKYKRPKFWIDKKAEASKDAIIGDDGIAVVGVGLLPEKHFNLIADMADEMIQWASVETSVCFAIINGEKLVGSVRSVNSSLNVNDFCDLLGGKDGSGGGRDGKGSYTYSMQGLAIEDDDDDETKDQMWDTINQKETKRIFKMMKK
jgi:nanoRNase/pAp phosphatase (c-di-AMP/oligoRNAs hydrolase)